jgi:protein O-mannosyl-transferase
MIFYCRYLKTNGMKRYYYAAIFLFLLSLMSKVMAATLPLELILIDYLFGRKYDRPAIIDKIPFFTLSFLFGTVAVFAMSLS